MRYLGNKTSLLDRLDKLITSLEVAHGGVFCDAFAGTGVVGAHFADRYKIISNDTLFMSNVLSHSSLNPPKSLEFSKLGLDPFVEFKKPSMKREGFIYNTYSPAHGRMYYSEENAQYIDGARHLINEWREQKLINESEYFYLVACLLEASSKRANVAGVYGAYLKHWDSRALKPLDVEPLPLSPRSKHKNIVLNKDVLSLVRETVGDILYLDPPTRALCSKHYHLPETIARGDEPWTYGVTGLPNRDNDVAYQPNNWTRDGYAQKEFEELIAEANYTHIILSYSSAGILSKKFIENVLKRHGESNTYKLVEIPYKKYPNSNTNPNTTSPTHYEYLFYVRKKPATAVIYESPMNYTGNKAPLAEWLREQQPSNTKTLFDVFGGGLNAGLNLQAENLVYNDSNQYVVGVLQHIKDADSAELTRWLNATIKKLGLSKNNKEAYQKLRDTYNKQKVGKRDPRLLLLLIMYGFQNQLRFNTAHGFNNPVGLSEFNDSIHEKLVSFSRTTKNRNLTLLTGDYKEVFQKTQHPTQQDLVYLDPPYYITLGSYNDGKRGFKGWGQQEETELYEWVDSIAPHTRFMLSNVYEHKGQTNHTLKKWANKYETVHYEGGKARGRKEIIVKNY